MLRSIGKQSGATTQRSYLHNLITVMQFSLVMQMPLQQGNVTVNVSRIYRLDSQTRDLAGTGVLSVLVGAPAT